MLLVSCRRSVCQALNRKLNPKPDIKNQLEMVIDFNVKCKIFILEDNT